MYGRQKVEDYESFDTSALLSCAYAIDKTTFHKRETTNKQQKEGYKKHVRSGTYC